MEFGKRKITSMKWTVSAILLTAMLLTVYLFVEPYILETKTYRFESGGTINGIKMVYVTDIHHGPFFSIGRVHDLVVKINALQPDVVLLGGDYVHRDVKYIEPVFRELKNIRAKYLVASVLGNHDHWESRDLTVSNIIRSGFFYLDNRSTNVMVRGRNIRIAGVGDLWEDKQDISSITTNRMKHVYTVLVTHNPDYVEKIDGRTISKIDLILAGHTHGGQVSLFGLWAPLVPSKYGQKYRTGLKMNGKTRLLISNGIGTITPPVRFFTRPQVMVVEI